MKISIIIPAYREVGLREFLKQLIEKLKPFDYEIIVVFGLDKGDNPSDIKVDISDKSLIFKSCEKGRGRQLNYGLSFISGEIVIFLHADTIINRSGIEDILSRSDIYDYGAFRLKIDNRKYIFRIIEFIVYLRSKFLKLPYGDQTIFIKRDILQKIGGVKNLPLFEDVELMLRCKRHKLRFYLSGKCSYTSDRRWRKNGVLKTSMKNLRLLFMYLIGIDTNKLYEIYYKK